MKNLVIDPKTGCQLIRKTIPVGVRGHVIWPPALADHVGLTTFKLSLGLIGEDEARSRAAPIISVVCQAIEDAKAQRRGIKSTTDTKAVAAADPCSPAVATEDAQLEVRDINRLLPLPIDPEIAAETCAQLEAQAGGRERPEHIIRLLSATLHDANLAVPWEITYAEKPPGGFRVTAADLNYAVSIFTQTMKAKAPTITAVTEDFLAAERPKEERQIRYYVRRLVEKIGDKPVDEVTKLDMTRMLVSLRQFPVIKSGVVKSEMTYGEILEHFQDHDDRASDPIPRILGKTIRTKWFAAYRQIFAFAVAHDIIYKSPVVMPKKARDGSRVRRAFEADEIVAIFRKPPFTGNKGAARGYLCEPGDFVTRDARYWLPILSLTTGMRLAEMANALTEDVRQVNDVQVFDLTYRNLKTKHSRRFVPLSRLLFENLGFQEYVAERRQAGAARLFDVSPAQWGKWWGLWMTENGFADPDLSFHSFHTASSASPMTPIRQLPLRSSWGTQAVTLSQMATAGGPSFRESSMASQCLFLRGWRP